MKKLLILAGFALFSMINAQQTEMVINNYSAFDYKGQIIANGFTSCYPQVSNTYYPEPTYYPLKVGAGTNVNVGKYFSNNAVSFWDVQTSPTNPLLIRLYSHPQLNPIGPLSQGTDWNYSKFSMYYAGTNNKIPFSGIAISNGTGACFSDPSYVINGNGTVEAEWFKIGAYSYLQIY